MEKQQQQQQRGATLVLADGTRYRGVSFGAEKSVGGECVFQTGMVGYVESLTDPSYRGQLLVLSYPLIGNYGAPPEDAVDEYGLSRFMESDQVHISALIVADYSAHYSHWNAKQSLGDWLKAHNVPAIHSIDTRALIKKIRDSGSMLAKIVLDGDDEAAVVLDDPNQRHLVAEVSRREPVTYGSGSIHVVAVDCGMKNNQIRCFLKRGVRVKVVPWDWPLLDEQDVHGFFFSNGPGDPMFCQKTIENLRALLARESTKPNPIPIFGICLGNQILGLAAGARTYKLKFGNRGHNQPCVDVNTKRCHLTSQNHGFAIDAATLPAEWQELFYNANDRTNEGIQHRMLPFFSCQFHPEAKGGPWDTEYLFDVFLGRITAKPGQAAPLPPMALPSPPKAAHRFDEADAATGAKLHKVLILGSGGLSIGQAGEFDYSGSQAIKALKQERIQTILINPNIATVQTSPGLADKVYFLPVTPEFVVKLIEWERPDGILLTFGGQTALNCGIELYKQGIFERYNVRVLGTPLEAIIATEDREVFAQELLKINEKIAPSVAARSLDEALKAAEKIGYPVVVRAGFALGGLGSGFANDVDELRKLATMAFAQSEQVLVEKSLKGWKEIEYEVVRDAYDNCVTVCNMENFDPLGIHTGESIVVAPSQTLSDQDYFMLRDVAIRVVRHLGIVGECNIQYALNPDSEEYFIIEVNARLSRSSALASKATGYPLAFIAAKLALGVPLPTLRNAVTKTTTACWEPSLDYVVVKMPRWDLQKFQKVDGEIGTSMKSVGEVMAIGRTFEETIQKAIRMVNGSQWDGFQSGLAPASTEALTNPSSNRILVIAQALHEGLSVEQIHQLTKIDRWFLHKLKGLSDLEKTLRKLEGGLTHDLLTQAKRLGFADKQVAKFLNSTELVVRKTRKEFNIRPRVKQIDTVAAEFPAYNNYLYMTYNGVEDDIELGPSADEAERPIIVLGSGAYCIGSSVEFDYCAVRCAQTLSKLGKKTIMINYNPETVSTDYDECDKLYFEELSFERVVDIYENEQAAGVVVSMGGQIPNNMSMALGRQGVRILGTTPEMIESSENRFKFSRMLDLEGVDQPKWKDCSNLEETKRFCAEVGYPCLVRPSFVLSGAGMTVVNTPTELETYLTLAQAIDTGKDDKARVVISKFIVNAKEVDLDAVAQDGEIITLAISEHVENAGVHSGDATLILPAQDLDRVTVDKIEAAARKIAKQLQVSGPFNMQFIAKDNEIKVIECNLRASRSFPFVSKTMGIDFIELATKALLGMPLTPQPLPKVNHVGVKVPQFSFSRLPGADPVMGVEMASTGEVACFGANKYEAYMKALLSTGFKLPKKRNIFLSLGPYKEKVEFLESAQKLVNMGYNLFGTAGTADFLGEHSIPIKTLSWDQEAEESDLETLSSHLSAAKIDLCIILPSNNRNRRPASFMSKGYMARRLAINYSVPLITNIKCAKLFIECLRVVPSDIPIGLIDSRSSSRTVILPGLIDVHVHVREPGATHKEDWDTCTAAALAGGITMICAMPNTNPEVIDAASMDLVSSLAKSKARCDYGLYFGASSDNARLGAQFVTKAVALKMYLNQTFTRLRLDDMSTWMEHFTHWPKELPIVVHAEATTMAAALMVATLHDRPLHIAHVCLKEELAVIRAAKAKGIRVTCEVCPHHLFLDKDISACGGDHAHGHGHGHGGVPHLSDGRKEVRPRLATRADVEALWANMDIIDCIATDHAPHTLAEKDGPNPPPGFPGLETALPLMLTAVNQGRITLEDLIAKMYTNPKRIFNLPDQEDTYVVVNMDDRWTVPAAMAHSRCGWTPFAGMTLQGRVVRVVLRGKTAMLDGQVYALPGEGRDVCAAGAARLRAPAAAVPSPVTTATIAVTPAAPSVSTPTTMAKTSAAVSSSSSPTVLQPARPAAAAAAVITPPARRHRSPSVISPTAGGAAAAATASAAAGDWTAAPSSEIFFAHSGAVPPRFAAKHVTSVKQFTRDDLRYLFSLAHDMRMMVKRMGAWDLLKGKVLANVFYEPSTRTSSSFQAAMLRLGGTVISVNESSSSVAKGESLPDTVRTLECYADAIVLRHPQAGAAQVAAAHARVPIINAGDGIGEHPTQALLDAFTIREELGTINGLRITMVGDLKNGRTVHSLVHLLSLYSIAQLNYVSPASLRMPSAILDEMDKKGVPQRECSSLEEVLPHTDVLYVTRIQKERFASEEEYLAVKGTYVITPELLSHAKSNLVIMHPLPRVDEISPEIDSDPRAAYFRQMENGMYIRMALLATILSSHFS